VEPAAARLKGFTTSLNILKTNQSEGMQLTAIRKIILCMKLTSFLLLACCLSASARGFAQKVTLHVKDAPVQKVFTEISRQTGISIVFSETQLNGLSPVTLNLEGVPVSDALNATLKNQPLSFTTENGLIVISKKALPPPPAAAPVLQAAPPPPPNEIHGRVVDSTGAPLANASVIIKGTKRGTQTDANGRFSIKYTESNIILVFSFTGYQTHEEEPNGEDNILVVLHVAANTLQDVIINKGYYTEQQQYSVGNVTKVTSKEIEQQPVLNVLQAIQAKVPGLFITQTTGVPGGSVKVQLRGQNSLFNSNDLFYVIDGVPFNSKIPTYFSESSAFTNDAIQGGNPLNYINPEDIESVEVLKDADATAIYGSRAANGAILITTKKGKAGPMKVSLTATGGFSLPARIIPLLNTSQYLAVRHDAFANDGKVPGPADHDVNGDWDSTRYTNWPDVLLNNRAAYMDYEANMSGGSANVQWLVGAGYHQSATDFSRLAGNSGADRQPSAHFNITASSPNQRFKIALTGNYVSDKNTVPAADLTQSVFNLPPDAPALLAPDGTLNWAPLKPGQPGTWTNPLQPLLFSNKIVTANLVTNANLSYKLTDHLSLQASLGYNSMVINEQNLNPTTATDPGLYEASGNSHFRTNSTTNWIVEPMLSYSARLGPGNISALVGGSFSSSDNNASEISAQGFSTDALLANPGAAASYSVQASNSSYRYAAAYSRINYIMLDKYIINLTGRRDGSSRFGPGKQFGNFGSAGIGWILSKEHFLQGLFPALSFAKLRASYGITGNDGIGDYQFLDLYQPTGYPYGNAPGLYPANLFNTQLAWERVRKLEFGITLGFFNDRVNLEASYYKNQSGDQLVATPLPLITGYSSVTANFPATVQNTGVEFVLHSVNIKGKTFSWSTGLNFSVPRNKLLAFPGFATSVYAHSNLMIGQPVSLIRVYPFAGVDPTTGLYQFVTAHGDLTSKPSFSTDRTVYINTNPKFFGALENTFTFKGFALDFTVRFVKQTGKNLFGSLVQKPGSPANIPVTFLDYWEGPGDNATYEKPSQVSFGAVQNSFNAAKQSEFAYGDASFIRLQNIAFSWQLPSHFLSRLNVGAAKLFVNAQDLLTITKYNGIDPESQGSFSGPRKTFVGGINVTF